MNYLSKVLFAIVLIFSLNTLAQQSCSERLSTPVSSSRQKLNVSPDSQGEISRSALEQMARIQQGESRYGVLPEDKTRFFLHKNQSGEPIKTLHTVVIYHGLWNTPKWTNWLAEIIFDMGFNVINARLPKHGRAHVQSINTLDLEDFTNHTRIISGLSEELGLQTVYIGHSAGGNSAIHSAVTHSDSTSGLIALGSALELRPYTRRMSFILGRTFLSNIPLNWVPETYDRYRSLGAGRATHWFAEHLRDWDGGEDFSGLETALSRLNALLIDVTDDGTISNEVNMQMGRGAGIDQVMVSSDLAHVQMLDNPEQHDEGTPQREQTEVILETILNFLTDIQSN